MQQLCGNSINYSAVLIMIKNHARSLSENQEITTIHHVGFKKITFKCFKCGEQGHIARFCKSTSVKTNNIARRHKIARQCASPMDVQPTKFILDNAASIHAVTDRNLMSKIKKLKIAIPV